MTSTAAIKEPRQSYEDPSGLPIPTRGNADDASAVSASPSESTPTHEAPVAPDAVTKIPVPSPHTHGENLAAIITASAIMALGLCFLKASGTTTGGTDGVALQLSRLTGMNLGVAVLVVPIPFYVLGLRYKGWMFLVRSVLVSALIATMIYVAPVILGPMHPEPLYGAIMGNVLVGLGLLMLLRHDASPAGFVIISTLLQEKKGWRAGYVQAAIDTTIVATALTYAPPLTVLYSGIGALVVGFILATNHRPGRYIGGESPA